jgi:hypothetical protein
MPIIGIMASQNYPRVVLPPISGYQVWLDASDTSTITDAGAGAVSSWLDKSNNAYTFINSTSAQRPTTGTRTVNSKNALDFDGTNDWLYFSGSASVFNYLHNATGGTAFVVLQADLSQASKGILTTSNSTNEVGVWYYLRGTPNDDLGAAILRGVESSFVTLEFGASYSASTTAAFAWKSDANNATAANRIKLYKNNGTETGTFNQSQGALSTSNAANPLAIGAFPLGTDNFNGLICEVIIYNSQLSDADIGTNMDYLKTKWGI